MPWLCGAMWCVCVCVCAISRDARHLFAIDRCFFNSKVVFNCHIALIRSLACPFYTTIYGLYIFDILNAFRIEYLGSMFVKKKRAHIHGVKSLCLWALVASMYDEF